MITDANLIPLLKRMKSVIEKYLSLGFKPPGDETRKPTETTAITAAAKEIGINPNTIRKRLETGGSCERLGINIDWTKYKPKNDKPAEPIEIRRLADQKAKAEVNAREAQRHAITSETIRRGILGLSEKPPLPPSWHPRISKSAQHSESLVIMLSDVHMGEVVDLLEMGGRNSYNKAIAEARLERMFQNIVRIGVERWYGPPPDVIYLLLMGDLISGHIHDELTRSNDLLSLPSVRAVEQCIIAGITMLLANFKCAIRVISVPGNHSRLTKKPEAKSFAVESYDTLVFWMVETWFASRNEKRVTFSAPLSGDALINIHGYNFVVTHGDRIGSKGGMGFIGPAATIARGMQKVIQDYSAMGDAIDYVLIGHFHTALELEQGFCNGPVVGPSEFSKTLRLKPAPATQWLLSIHPSYGVVGRWKLQIGQESEGSLYRPRE